MKKYRKILLGSLILIGLFSFSSVDAIGLEGPIVPCGLHEDIATTTNWDESKECTVCDLWKLVSNIITFISFDLTVPVGAFLFIVAGVLFLTSGGNEKRLGLARSIFTNTVIGILIIFVSWLLIDSLIKTTVSKNFETTGSRKIYYSWNEFPACP